MKKRVAHLTECYAQTGEAYIYDQVRLTRRYDGFLLAEAKAHSTYDPVGNVLSYKPLLKKYFSRRVANFLRREVYPQWYNRNLNDFFSNQIQRSGCDIIHAHFGMLGARVLATKRKLSKPLVISFYGVDASFCVRSPYWIPRYKKMFEGADMLITLCEEASTRLKELGCPESKIREWDIGISLDEYRWRKPALNENVKFLCVARFVEKKGHFYLLRAFAEAARTRPNISLTLLGHGHLKPEIQRLVAELNLASKVNIIDSTGMLNFYDVHKAALFKHDVFVLPSVIAKNGDDESGVPVVITHAMATGLPVISTPIGGINRAVKHQETGLLTEPENIDSLSGAICHMADHPNEWESLSKSGRQTMQESFSLETQISRLESIYDELI